MPCRREFRIKYGVNSASPGNILYASALREGKTGDAIEGLLREYIAGPSGTCSPGSLEMRRIVEGYTTCFKKAGLV